jgi:molybdenum cofactor cytidylyltransferase
MKTRPIYGMIVLAAGASTRLGRPKQLLPFRNTTLLAWVTALVAEVVPVTVVVLGACGIEIEADLRSKGLEVIIAHNPEWNQGMGSSVRCGVQALLQTGQALDGIFIVLCDQPYLTKSILQAMKRQQSRTRKKIIACRYGKEDAIGPPVLFGPSYFDALLTLKGEAGAKKVVIQHLQDAAFVRFPKGSLDVDTEPDYQALIGTDL